jgi:hypothetical protein
MVALVAELEALVSRWQALVETTNTAEDAGFIQTTQGKESLCFTDVKCGRFLPSLVVVSDFPVLNEHLTFSSWYFRAKREVNRRGKAARDV